MKAEQRPLELWGGIECTVNRVRGRTFDQIAWSGHAERRAQDWARFAALGIRTWRTPLLWERIAPEGLARGRWGELDETLGTMRELGLRPIAGLLHHGSGPRHCGLLDPDFPARFAEYAAEVAARAPWVEDWTPVNEPHSTARFSGLYGLWHPHGRSEELFCRVMLAEAWAIARAMRAIRAVIPAARHVYTEDACQHSGTEEMRAELEHRNHRRFLSIDLVAGRVDPRHPLWGWLLENGVAAAELDALRELATPPDLLGLNYYATSDRFLDHRVGHYPRRLRVPGGPRPYVDVEAVRVSAPGLSGLRTLLGEYAARYGCPVAVTEAHLGCTREEQARWLIEAWEAAHLARQDGVDVRAVTVWAALGSFEWCHLVTRPCGAYEPGLFDVRAPEPRPTLLARVARQLASGQPPSHPAVEGPGWWRRDDLRLIYPPTVGIAPGCRPRAEAPRAAARRGAPLLVAGATGTLGRAFARLAALRGMAVITLSRRELDIADPAQVGAAIARIRPWAVVNAAGYVRVDEAEHHPATCARENTLGPVTLAARCAEQGLPLVTFSSDLVFDGAKGSPYVETDAPAPLGAYGRSKALAEEQVLAIHPGALVVRTAAFFGPWDPHNFVIKTLRQLVDGAPIRAASDAVVSPTFVPDLVNAALDLLLDGERGLWHIANAGAVTWVELAREAARLAGCDVGRVEPATWGELGLVAPRPAWSALKSERGWILPALDSSLSRCVREGQPLWRGGAVGG